MALHLCLSFFLAVYLATGAVCSTEPGQNQFRTISEVEAARYTYVDVKDLGVHGKGFSDTQNYYDRLPAAAQGVVSGSVWGLSLDTAGMYVQFETNSNVIAVNATLRSGSLSMWHFPSTGVSGLDLYLLDEQSVWRWVGTTRAIRYPKAVVNVLLEGGHPAVNGSTGVYRLHLPLYNGIVDLFVGVQSGSTIKASPPDFKYHGAVVWYGTSIAQGGVATRPGQAFTNVIGRDLGVDMYNFGFSGHGLMEADVAEFLLKIPDISAFVIDCNPNMQGPEIAERAMPLVQQITKAHPTAAIVMSEGTTYGAAWYNNNTRTGQAAKRAALQKAYQDAVAAGIKNVHYVKGDELMCIDAPNCYVNPTVGGTHPTDLGMRAIATYYKKFLPTILATSQSYTPRTHSGAFHGKHQPAYPNPISTQDRLAFFQAALPEEHTRNQRRETAADPVQFTSLMDLTVRGRAFNNTKQFFNRLPAPAEGVVRDQVFNLSQMATGIHVRFVTDATTIWLNYTLSLSDSGLWHMPPSGTSGCDLYIQAKDAAGKPVWRWVGTVTQFSYPAPELIELASGLPSGENTYALYLPLRNTLIQGQIGVPTGSTIRPDTSYVPKKPVVWYGTSICQGGVASRAGMTYTNVISQQLSTGNEVWNFGFAGNGKMEINVAEFLTEIDAAAFIIDCNPNLQGDSVAKLTQPLVKYFRQKHPTIPIVLAEGTTYGDFWLHGGTYEGQQAKREALHTNYLALVKAGDKNLHYVNGSNLFGVNSLINPTVGGTHPSDLGHHDVAEYYLQFLPSILNGDN
ncbi:uncharacterized protein LOC135815587 [Sycon ciliatum]|uniref:uncharacterized protein LOC135815587 n=1 Tax=Sycon ciliatum TaxID=27933 RepID=UPI0031F667D3